MLAKEKSGKKQGWLKRSANSVKSVIWCTDVNMLESGRGTARIGFVRLPIAILENALSVVNFT